VAVVVSGGRWGDIEENRSAWIRGGSDPELQQIVLVLLGNRADGVVLALRDCGTIGVLTR
jgi:hypothetical protein